MDYVNNQRNETPQFKKLTLHIDKLDVYIMNAMMKAERPLVVLIEDNLTNNIVGHESLWTPIFGVNDLKAIIEKFTPAQVSVIQNPYTSFNRAKLEKLCQEYSVSISFKPCRVRKTHFLA
ncbi:hypothetical protein N6H14_16320 [Paenibacillus sp. CC-CFT747]|nr:hypothetical protein N6H14_16320 [Paenibacillus sp. CC-CFT747]